MIQGVRDGPPWTLRTPVVEIAWPPPVPVVEVGWPPAELVVEVRWPPPGWRRDEDGVWRPPEPGEEPG